MHTSIARLKNGLTLHGHNEELVHGLPFEIWRVVFSYLRAKDLCFCSQVCKDWSALVNSLDATRWKQLYLEQKRSKRWKHPNWPNETNTQLNMPWKDLYKHRYKLSRLWLKAEVEASCTTRIFFGRRKERKTLHVGIHKPYHTLKAALDKASSYTKIVVHPGIYQDSSTVYLRFPVEIVGIDDASKIILMMQIEIRSDSAKLENLTINPIYPRVRGRGTSTAVVRVLSGHLYMYNCTIDQGCVHVVSPGMVTIRGCTFTSSFVNLQGIGYSSISCCDFTPNRFAILVEEPLFQFLVRPSVTPECVGGWVDAANEKKFEEFYKESIKGGSLKRKTLPDFSKIQTSISPVITDSDYSITDSDSETTKTVCTRSKKSLVNSLKSVESKINEEIPVLDSNVKLLIKSSQGVIIRNIKVSNGRGGITVCRMGQAWIENSTFNDLSYGIRCLQNSKCVILNNKIHSCDTTGIFMRDHSCGLVAGNQIFANGEAGIDIRSSADPIIQHNEIHSGRRSGIVCLENGKGTIRENDIYNNKEAGIYILHHGSPKIRNNFIWSGRAAGIAVTEEGRGHITHNVISGMEWAGIDVRHGGNPVISHNIIKNGQSDGIVIGEKGKSVILDNTIEGNCGCGIWILDGSYPLVHSNRIIYSGSNGIAFVSSSDQEHDSRRFDPQFSPNERRQNNDDLMIDEGSLAEEEFPIPLPEVEPESRYIHVSKPEKTLAQIESNFVENNRGNGILYDGQEGIVISKNRISGNSKHGITLLRSNEITIQSNMIRNNLLTGLHIDVGVCCLVVENGIFENKEYGIYSGGLGTIKGNDILSHFLPSIFIRSMANVSILKNRLHSWKHESIYIEEKSRVSVEENEFFVSSKSVKEICIHPGSDTTYTEELNLIHTASDKFQRYEEGLTVEDLCLGTEELDYETLKPNLLESASTSAPFFTSMQLNKSNNLLQRSSFCALL